MAEALGYRGRKAEVESIVAQGLGTREMFDENYYPIPARPAFVTKDSGSKAEYSDGMRRDTTAGKPKFTLMFPEEVPYEEQLLTRVAALYERGGKKYGDRNWEKSCTEESLAHHEESLMRHVVQFLLGVDDGEDHAAAVVWNVNAVLLTRWNLAREEANPPAKQPPQLECLRCRVKTYTLYYGRCHECDEQESQLKIPVVPQEEGPAFFRYDEEGNFIDDWGL
jgi:hypothetical protein